MIQTNRFILWPAFTDSQISFKQWCYLRRSSAGEAPGCAWVPNTRRMRKLIRALESRNPYMFKRLENRMKVGASTV